MAKNTVVVPAIFEGHKNQWHISASGHMYLAQKARKQREAAILYLKSLQPIPEEYAIGCSILVDRQDNSTAVTFWPLGLYEPQRGGDLDGMVSFWLDAAQPSRFGKNGRLISSGAGIIHNDNRIHLINAEVK